MGDELRRCRCSGSDRGRGSLAEGYTPGSKGRKKKKKPCNLINSEVWSEGN